MKLYEVKLTSFEQGSMIFGDKARIDIIDAKPYQTDWKTIFKINPSAVIKVGMPLYCVLGLMSVYMVEHSLTVEDVIEEYI